ncbi:hypothetical protein DRP53_04480 [candidate division WOR-3 bacterium]|uniref:Orc1-like AAA ATPase domain-containing protein n=1 Tax=candidate division WOR-3 bacterium TaxID=2052148 RepID=A0A660SII3_UNCW3|nr:MAG: hypothetical protein DRP53_04480 [candidate division WOR-3 bacterium]
MRFLFPPPLPKRTLRRKKLIRGIINSLDYPLILITGPVGSGKTTLLTQLYQTGKARFTWLSIRSEDNDLTIFFTGLIRAIGKRSPSVQKELESSISPSQLPGPEELAQLLIQAIDKRVKRRLHLILDDLQNIGEENQTVNEFLNHLILRLPDKLHLIISSERHPSLPIPTFAWERSIYRIGLSDLCFSSEEVRQFLPGVSRDLLIRIIGLTGGYPAALVLIRNLIISRQTGDLPDRIRTETADLLSTRLLSLFPTLQEEVLISSLLPYLDQRIIRAITGSDQPYRLIQRLGSFQLIHPLEGERFIFHQVFQESLQETARRRFSLDRINSIYYRIAEYLKEEGDLETALKYYIEGESLNQALALIETCAPQLLNSGRCQTLLNYLNRFPPSYQSSPLFQLYYATIERFYGNWSKAKEYYLRCRKGLKGGNYLRCLYGLGATYLVLGEPLKTQRLARLGLKKARTGRLRMMFYNLLSTSLYEEGRIRSAILSYRKAIRLADRLGDEGSRGVLYINLGAAYADLGRFDQALKIYRLALNILGSNSPYSALIYTNLGSTHLRRGDLANAEVTLKRGLSLARRFGRRYDQIYLLHHLTDLELKRGNLNQAHQYLKELDRKSRVVSEGHIPALLDYYWAKFFYHQKKHLLARSRIEAALSRRIGRVLRGELKLLKAEILIESGLPHQARSEIEAGLKVFRREGCEYLTACGLLLLARLRPNRLADACRIIRRRGYRSLLLDFIDQAPHLLPQLIRLDPSDLFELATTRTELLYRLIEFGPPRMALTALQRLEAMEDVDISELKRIRPLVKARVREPLTRLIDQLRKRRLVTANLFGGFHGVELRSSLARKILAYLLLKKNHTASAQELTQLFWHQPYYKVRGRLYFTINLIRRLHPRLILRSSGGYRLNTELIESDILRFHELVNLGKARYYHNREEAKRYLEEARRIGEGELLPEFTDPIFDDYRREIEAILRSI